MPKGDKDAEAALGLHRPGSDLHRRVEDDGLEGHRRREHGHGVQEVLQGKTIVNWFSGNKRRLMFCRVWVRIPESYKNRPF